MHDHRQRNLEELRPWLLALIRSKCARWLVQESEDLVQETLIQISKIEAERAEDNPLPRSYIRKMAYSRLVDEIRRRRILHIESLDEEASTPRVHDPTPTPDRTSESAAVGSAILACLAKLVEPRKIAVSLHLRGHAHGEISQRMGWKIRRTHNLVFRGMENLRRCLDQKGMRP